MQSLSIVFKKKKTFTNKKNPLHHLVIPVTQHSIRNTFSPEHVTQAFSQKEKKKVISGREPQWSDGL